MSILREPLVHFLVVGALLFALFGVTGMYAFLGADFLVATQVIGYGGGILVLVLFAVMMTHRVQAKNLNEELIQPFAAGAAALVHQYFEEGRYPGLEPLNDASAALMKAMLINAGHRLTGANLGDGTEIHDCHSIRDVTDHGQVMGDKQQRQAE